MPLPTGTRFGPYEILEPIGAGGMGEVYKARDTRLSRTVAIKVSKTEFTERFEREAQAVAALNHPHICQLYDVGPNYLVFEYVEGEPLKGPQPLEKALGYAAQICEALEAAHVKKITHRDLKPDNILLTKRGVKILDFGLAKIDKPVSVEQETVTMALTSQGQILGTLQYMAPEQLQGKEVDARSDIFSFGCVLYEILTGKRAFEGASAASVIAAILERPAPSIAEVAPPALDQVLKRCLEKDPENRWQSAADLRWALKNLGTAPSAAQAEPRAKGRRLPWAVAGILAAGAGALAWLHFGSVQPRAEQVRFRILPPDKNAFTDYLAVSPDGNKIAFVTSEINNRHVLWVRSMGSLEPQLLANADQDPNSDPIWSPDSKFIAYYARGKLWRVEASGGPAQALCNVAGALEGGSWSKKGVIIFGIYPLVQGKQTGIWKVPDTGGTPQQVTEPRAGFHESPWFLPDGVHFLYRAAADAGGSKVLVGSTDLTPAQQDSRELLAVRSQAEFAPSAPASSRGWLLFMRDMALVAQPFDATSLTPSGEAAPVASPVANHLEFAADEAGNPLIARSGSSVSQNGVLAYRADVGRTLRLSWLDREGKVTGTPGQSGIYSEIDLSPNGKQLAAAHNGDIWILDLERNVTTRFTFDGAGNRAPVWSPDGSKIAYSSARNGNFSVVAKPVQGSDGVTLYKSSDLVIPTSWSRDGKSLVLTVVSPQDTGADLMLLPISGGGTASPLLATKFQEGQGQISPDGHWLAYASGESGSNQVYVRSFPSGDKKWLISNGVEPRWSTDGRALYYRNNSGIMEVDVNPGADLRLGEPKQAVAASVVGAGGFDRSPSWAVAPDGKHFLAMLSEAGNAPDTIDVILNWQDGLKQ